MRLCAVLLAVAAAKDQILERPFPSDGHVAEWQDNIDTNAKGPLSQAQIQEYKDEGFVYLKGIIDEAMLQEIQQDVTRALNTIAVKLYNSGKISKLYDELDWTRRMVEIGKEFPDAAVIFTKQGFLHKSLQKMYANPKLMDILEQLGMEHPIAVHPAWNLRVKIPHHQETEVPFHQDNSYWEPRLWGKTIATFWIPLVDATVKNGALEFIRGGHKSGKTCTHTVPFGNTWYTETSKTLMEKELGVDMERDRVVVTAKRGDAILFANTIPHRSLENLSKGMRWSIDLRYHTAYPNNDGESPLDYFYGLKDSLIVRDKSNPSLVPDFATWAGQDRTKIQDAGMNKLSDTELDPIVIGPWMDLWSVTDENRHMKAYLEQLEAVKEEL